MNRSQRRNAALTAQLLLSMLCVAGTAEAQVRQSSEALRLSLPDAVARALSESEEMATVRAQVDQAEAQVTQATAGALPQLTSNLTYNRAIKTIFDDIGSSMQQDDTSESDFGDVFKDLPFGRRNTYLASFQLNQLLWSGGSVGAARDIARRLRSSTLDQVEEAEADITFQVRTAYLSAQLAIRMLEIAVASRQVVEEHLRQVEAFYRAGTSSEFDLLRARVDLQNRDPAVVQAENAAELAMLELKRLVNIPAADHIELTSALDPGRVDIDVDALAQLLNERPALNAAREAVGMAEAAVRVYRAQRWPSLRLIGNMGFQAFPEHVTPPGLDQWREDWSVSLAVSWNPFDGLRTRGQIAEAQAQMRLARVQETQLREGLEVEFAAAIAEYESAQAQLEASRETVSLARRTLELADVRFANGLSTQLEVSDAALLLDEAQVNEARAQHDYARALAHLERLTGGRLQLLRYQ